MPILLTIPILPADLPWLGGTAVSGWDMKGLLTITLAMVCCTGCTTVSLQRNTLAHSDTLSDIRYREVVEDLAIIAHDPWELPAFSSIYAGTTDISDSVAPNSQTTWVRNTMGVTTFGTEFLDIPLKRTAKLNWTLNPILVPEKLQAMRCACWWVLFGPQNSCGDCTLLKKYDKGKDCPGYYFGVDESLNAVEPCWLHVGAKCQVPANVCYHAECKGTHVWVTPEGLRGLSDFTLILQKIARTDLGSVYAPRPQTRLVKVDKAVIPGLPADVESVTLYIDQNGLLAPGPDSSV